MQGICLSGGEDQENQEKKCRGLSHLMIPTKDCCNINLTPEQEECGKKIREKWMEKRESADKENVDMSDVGCASDCFFSTDIASSENEINAAEAKVQLDKILGAEWQSMIPNIIATCKNRAEKKPAHKGGKKFHCNMTKEFFMFCVHEHVIELCPNPAWNDVDQCNKARNFLKECPYEKRAKGPKGRGPKGQQGEA